jgi:hypothetical protein
MDKETEQLHESDRGLDLAPVLLIHPHHCVRTGHHDLPNYLLRYLVWAESPVFRYARCVALLFQLYELSSTHPQVVDMPTLKYVPEILPEQQPLKTPRTVDHVNPSTVMPVRHQLKCLP